MNIFIYLFFNSLGRSLITLVSQLTWSITGEQKSLEAAAVPDIKYRGEKKTLKLETLHLAFQVRFSKRAKRQD